VLVRERVITNNRLTESSHLLVLIKDLHPDKDVEYHSPKPILLTLCFTVVKNAPTSKVENECYDKLEDGLSDYHLPHRKGDQRSGSGLGSAIENGPGGWISSYPTVSYTAVNLT
jgi:hypothetical protein